MTEENIKETLTNLENELRQVVNALEALPIVMAYKLRIARIQGKMEALKELISEDVTE